MTTMQSSCGQQPQHELQQQQQQAYMQADTDGNPVRVFYQGNQYSRDPPPYAYRPPGYYDYASHVQYQQHETYYVYQPVPVKQSFASHLCLSCFVFWLCGGLFGTIAFILASKQPNTC